MTRALQSRAYWLVPCALTCALLTSLPSSARGAGDPREWLEKMNKALATRNYDGTFFHLSGGRLETMRVVHRVRAGRVTERLQALDGSGREFLRANDELTCYLPDQHTVLVEPRQDRDPSWAHCRSSTPPWAIFIGSKRCPLPIFSAAPRA